MWETSTEIILAILAGVLGGIAVGRATREHSLGMWVDAIAGGVGALLGAVFLRDQVLLVVKGAGDLDPTGASPAQTALLVIAAAAEGAILALVVELVKRVILEHAPK
jgi:ABC-type Co2+ transport system permease subunit